MTTIQLACVGRSDEPVSENVLRTIHEPGDLCRSLCLDDHDRAAVTGAAPGSEVRVTGRNAACAGVVFTFEVEVGS